MMLKKRDGGKLVNPSEDSNKVSDKITWYLSLYILTRLTDIVLLTLSVKRSHLTRHLLFLEEVTDQSKIRG